MTENTDQIVETFAAHEHLAPDSAVVLAAAHGIAKSYQRRRWAVRASGGAVLASGLVVGGIALPGLAGPSHHGKVTTITAADGGGNAAPTTAPTDGASAGKYSDEQEFTAYFSAGYDYSDAQQLAQLWNDGKSTGAVKAEAGGKLLDGETLPIPPSGTPETPSERAQGAFFAAGYGYDDAVQLGRMWHETDLNQVKTEAGQKLEDGQTLPIPPTGDSQPATPSGDASSSPTKTDTELYAFFAAGYTYDDAVQLGQLWNESRTSEVKADAGQKLLDGKTLPIDPSGTPESKDDTAVHAFFAAGYDYDDAVRLSKMWNEPDISQVKVDAGNKVLNGDDLPFAP